MSGLVCWVWKVKTPPYEMHICCAHRKVISFQQLLLSLSVWTQSPWCCLVCGHLSRQEEEAAYLASFFLIFSPPSTTHILALNSFPFCPFKTPPSLRKAKNNSHAFQWFSLISISRCRLQAMRKPFMVDPAQTFMFTNLDSPQDFQMKISS